MDSSRFAEAFPPLREKVQPSNADRREILEAPRQWMRFFNETLYDYLTEEIAPDSEWLRQQLVDYFAWNQLYLDKLSKDAWAIHNPDGTTYTASSEFSFHKLSAPMILFWDTLVNRWEGTEATLSSLHLDGMQTHLAMGSVQDVRRYQQLMLKNALTSAEDEERKLLIGNLTEVDAAITLIEIAKSHPELIIVPAPSRFEENIATQRQNSDFIIIDTDQRQAHGIQVKASVDSRSKAMRYDPTYTTVIDGSADLGNAPAGLRSYKITTAPGQLALKLLAERPINANYPLVDKADFMRKRAAARELSRNTKPYLATATKHVAERVLHNLYREEPASQPAAGLGA